MKLLFIIFVCVYSVFALPKAGKLVPLKNRPNGRIIGGQPAYVGQYPYAAAIRTSTPDGNYFCTGTLLGPEYVLTAGQCVDGVILFTVILGTTQLDTTSPETLRVATDIYFLHPDYNPITLANDIGVIKFRLPIKYTDYVNHAYLPYFEQADSGSTTTVYGWGQTGDEDPGLNNDLHYVILSFVSNDECRLTYGSQITDNVICAAGNFNEGICLGDSGSPLINYVSRGYNIIHGVASFLSGNGCESPDPSGYTKVWPYNDWIRNVTNNAVF